MLDTIPESNMMAESYRSITQTGIAFLKEKFDLKKQKQGPFFLMLHVLQTLLSELPAGTLKFNQVLGVNKEPNFKEFVNFLQIMEVYGCGYQDDIDGLKN